MKSIRKNIYLPAQMVARLAEYSKKTGLLVSEVIRRAVDDYLRKEGQR